MVKSKKQRTRTFKVSADFEGIPKIRFGGKYLTREFDLIHGDRIKMIPLGDSIILRKLTDAELEAYEIKQQEKSLLKAMKTMLPKAKHAVYSLMVSETQGQGYPIENLKGGN